MEIGTCCNFVFQSDVGSECSEIQPKKGRSPPLPTLSKQAMSKNIRTPVIFTISLSVQILGLLFLMLWSCTKSSSNCPSLGQWNSTVAEFGEVFQEAQVALLLGGAEVLLVLEWTPH